MAMRKMTMQQVREFLNKNNFGYITSIAGENVIEHIEAMVYPPSKMSVHFFVHQSDEERAEEIQSIKTVHKIRGKELK